MTYASSLRSGSAPDVEEIKQTSSETSIRGFIRLPASGSSLGKPFFQCHQCYQRNATNIYEMAITTIVVFPSRDCCGWFGDCQARPTAANVSGRSATSCRSGAWLRAHSQKPGAAQRIADL